MFLWKITTPSASDWEPITPLFFTLLLLFVHKPGFLSITPIFLPPHIISNMHFTSYWYHLAICRTHQQSNSNYLTVVILHCNHCNRWEWATLSQQLRAPHCQNKVLRSRWHRNICLWGHLGGSPDRREPESIGRWFQNVCDKSSQLYRIDKLLWCQIVKFFISTCTPSNSGPSGACVKIQF